MLISDAFDYSVPPLSEMCSVRTIRDLWCRYSDGVYYDGDVVLLEDFTDYGSKLDDAIYASVKKNRLNLAKSSIKSLMDIVEICECIDWEIGYEETFSSFNGDSFG